MVVIIVRIVYRTGSLSKRKCGLYLRTNRWHGLDSSAIVVANRKIRKRWILACICPTNVCHINNTVVIK